MKNLFVLMGIIVIVCFTACGQTGKDLPSEVKTAFSRKFPDATGVKWDKESDTEWEAEFKLNGTEYTASFDPAGTWMETEYEITSVDIPTAVKSKLDNEFSDYKIEESVVSETPEGKVYEFELKAGKEEMDITIDMSGNVVKKERVEQEEEEEGDEDDD